MKHFLVVLLYALSALGAAAQDTKITIKSIEASSYQSGTPAGNAIDGDISTIWHSTWSPGSNTFPVKVTITFEEPIHIDYLRYVPRQSGANGNWENVTVSYAATTDATTFTEIGTYSLGGSSNTYDFMIPNDGEICGKVLFTINSGKTDQAPKMFASAAEIEAYAIDRTKENIFKKYFSDDLFTEPTVSNSDNIADEDVKALVQNLLTNKTDYMKFRVGEYEPYMTVSTLQSILKTNNPYSQYENPTGIYLKEGESCYVAVTGIGSAPVNLTIKNWVANEDRSSYRLRNGLNYITATTEGNVFVSYYTDDYKTASNVKVHFINVPDEDVLGYWDSEKEMTNEDWAKMLEGRTDDDQTIIITRSKHAQLAYPIGKWIEHNSTDIESTMEFYQHVLDGIREMMGSKYLDETIFPEHNIKNGQLFYATNHDFMAATGEGAYCEIGSLGPLMKASAEDFDFWGVGHEWGHNNQITPGFKWTGCGETTNNIYASWVQIKETPKALRLEDEVTGVNDYSNMRGGRMQTYFEEGLRKGITWQLQNGPDYHYYAHKTVTIPGQTADGTATADVTTTWREYDHFVKLSPFWQINLWGTLAGKSQDIIPQVIHAIRSEENYGTTYNTSGKQQINWMKLACDKAKMNLLPFFEKAGMLRPIHAYIDDYTKGWNIIDEAMIETLKTYVEGQGYPDITEEINYINGHNYHIYRDNLKLEIPTTLGEGCTYNGGKVTVQHASVKNAVAFETYNAQNELIRITMYALGSDAEHTYTQVLYPEAEGAAYIKAVGYDGERKTICEYNVPQPNRYYRIISKLRDGQGITATDNYTPKDGIFPSDGTGTVRTLKTATTDKKDIANLWQFDPVTSGSPYYIRNVNTKLAFANSTNSAIDCPVSDANAGSFELVSASERTGCSSSHWWIKRAGQNAYLNAWKGKDYNDVGIHGTKDDDGNIWLIEEATDVEVKVSAAGWATLCLPFEANIPTGLTAYIAGSATEEYIPLTPLESVIPANEPVLLEGAEGTYTFTINITATATKSETNTLSGTTVARSGFSTETPEYMALGNKNGNVGLYRSKLTKIPNNKAYYVPQTNEARDLLFKFDSEVTGIENVTNATATKEIFYNLNGQPVEKPTRGIYVTSQGKKVFFIK